MTKRIEPWQRLLTSKDLFSDFCDLYPPEFYVPYAKRFDRNPHPIALVRGVHATAKAYVMGKWRKRLDNSKLLKFSGSHLVGAGLAARRLAAELKQVNKSDLAAAIVVLRMGKEFGDGRDYGAVLEAARSKHLGPQSHLKSISETCAALESAIATVIDLPEDPDEELSAQRDAIYFVEEHNAEHKKVLSKNHPMESAAKAFRSVWEEFSTVTYVRGSYKPERSRYDCYPGDALHEIIAKLDSTAAASLAGTAIENIRTQP